ncbi:MAG: radical SAM protein [Kiritimatiellae bacterium]|nr:radical SAM protein [Kiritimatiellia bacterium]
MICTVPGQELSTRLRAAAEARDLPINGMLELTRRCCFRCVHCYAGPGIDAERELVTGEWLRIMDEAAAAGVLRLVLTGGEPMLRADFTELYSHARRAGMEVAVFSNAACLDDARLECLVEYPPCVVDVTLYGATAGVAARVTGVADAYARQWTGIERLRAAGLRVTLKTVAMRANRDEVAAIAEKARMLGIPFRFSTDLTVAVNGSHRPREQQLPVDEALAVELSDPGQLEARRAALEQRAVDGRRYPCRAGKASFFVAADGYLQACVAIRHHREVLANRPLLEVWRRVRAAVRAEKLPIAWHGEIGDNDSWLKGVMCTAMLYDEHGGVLNIAPMVKCMACERVRRLTGRAARGS